MPQLYPLGPDVSEQEYLAYHGQHSPGYSVPDPSSDYSNWNGDFYGYMNWLNKNGTEADHDRFIDFLMSEESSKIARDWTASREDTQYQRLVDDMKKAGINPYSLMNSGGQPVSSSSSGHSYTGAYSSNEALKKEANAQKWVSLITGILSTVVIAAVMMA